MSRHATELIQHLQHADGVLVTIEIVQGSGPREVGAWMAVFPQTFLNTIGGGHLEYQALEEARAFLARPVVTGASHEDNAYSLRYALGPALGQCCGGVIHLRYERITAADGAMLQSRLSSGGAPLALFGGGHVGRALIRVLSNLPYQVRWIDSRDEIFPNEVPANVVCEHSDPVHAAVDDLPAGSAVLIMSFSHAEDLDVLAACLKRHRAQADLPYIGLIGSKTKWATFQHRLEARGFTAEDISHVTCPIGVPGIGGKEPEVIAVAVAAQLLQQRAI